MKTLNAIDVLFRITMLVVLVAIGTVLVGCGPQTKIDFSVDKSYHGQLHLGDQQAKALTDAIAEAIRSQAKPHKPDTAPSATVTSASPVTTSTASSQSPGEWRFIQDGPLRPANASGGSTGSSQGNVSGVANVGADVNHSPNANSFSPFNLSQNNVTATSASTDISQKMETALELMLRAALTGQGNATAEGSSTSSGARTSDTQ